MSMADDKTLRSYRSNDTYRRNANADAQDMTGTDPLAELARLIGQSDPFTDTVRRQPQAAAPRMQDDPGDWRRHIQKPSFETREEPAFDADPRYAAADQRYATADQHAGYAAAGHSDPGYADPVYAEHDPYRMESPQQERYADPHADYRHDDNYAAAGDYPNEQLYAGAQHQGAYAAADSQQHGGGADGDDGYDDPPRRRSRGSSLVTAVVLIGCAMLGTAGAYGYRTYASAPGSKQAPVIIADNAPNKIVPSADQKSARVQDRVGGAGDERLVSREEQPVALPGTSSVPRVVFPSPVQPAPTTTGSTSASNAQASGGSMDQPKRIRTVPIRPEGGDTSGRPADEAPSRAAPPSARTAPVAPPPTRATRDQPLSLDPSSPAPAAEAARPQQRPLTPPAPRETAAPAPAARVAAVPPSNANGNSNGGGYLVQVSSQKSESDAQSSYRALQTKYSQLKSRQAVIRRADLGAKGVYYRAMVPFDSGDEAVTFCNGLKQAGGQCIILRN